MILKYTELIQVRVSPELLEEIRKESERLQLKQTDVIRMALVDAFHKTPIRRNRVIGYTAEEIEMMKEL